MSEDTYRLNVNRLQAKHSRLYQRLEENPIQTADNALLTVRQLKEQLQVKQDIQLFKPNFGQALSLLA